MNPSPTTPRPISLSLMRFLQRYVANVTPAAARAQSGRRRAGPAATPAVAAPARYKPVAPSGNAGETRSQWAGQSAWAARHAGECALRVDAATARPRQGR